MIRVTHVITGLGVGGAETALYRLLVGGDPAAVRCDVISLTDFASFGPRITELGIRVRALGLTRWSSGVGVIRLARWLRADRPDVVQTWMYHANLLGGLAARLADVPVQTWGIHQGDLTHTQPATRLVARVGARLSGWLPDGIVCCSERAREIHAGLGYHCANTVVIPYGFELIEPSDRQAGDRDPKAAMLRRRLGLGPTDVLVGRVGRFHAQKDYRTLITAAALVQRRRPNVHFLLCGQGVTADNQLLSGWLRDAGSPRNVHLLGLRSDMDALYRALDVACSTSCHGEGLPNTIGEAMAAGIPVVTTDVGDSAVLVGPTGRLVPPESPAALAEAIVELVDAGAGVRHQLGDAARARIGEHYSQSRMVDLYQALYASLVSRRPVRVQNS